MPFEGIMDYAAFSIRVPERDLEQLDTLLRAVTRRRQAAMPPLTYLLTYLLRLRLLLTTEHVELLLTMATRITYHGPGGYA